MNACLTRQRPIRHLPGRLPIFFRRVQSAFHRWEAANPKVSSQNQLCNDTDENFWPRKDWYKPCTSRCVFRLDKEFGEQRTRLTFDGEISTECIESLERCCEEALKDGKPVDLVLRDITRVDEAGQALLGRLAARGVCLFANGVYVSYLLDNIRGNVSANGKDRKQK